MSRFIHHAILLSAVIGASASMINSGSAQTTATGTGTANSSSNSGAVAISGGGQGGAGGAGGNSSSSSNSRSQTGNSTSSIIFNTPGSTTSHIRQSGSLKTTPNAIAPGLGSAAIETCYGPGVSAGLAVTGFGASFGAGQWDTSCNRRLNARTIFAMGYKQQAIAIMLHEPEVAEAFGVSPQTGAPAPVASYPQPRTATSRQQVGYIKPSSTYDTVMGGPRHPIAACSSWKGGVVGVQCLD